MIELVAGART